MNKPEKNLAKWQNSDPRDFFDKRGKIVFVSPFLVCAGEVDSKHTGSIFLRHDYPDLLRVICNSKTWDPDWFWALYPEKDEQ